MTSIVRETEQYAEEVNLLYRHAVIGMLATVVNGFILSFVLRNVVEHALLGLWLISLIAITILRYILVLRYRRSSAAPADALRWYVLFIIGIVLSGIVWGSTAIFLFPLNSIPHQVFVCFVVGGMVAGSVGTYSIKKAFLAFSIPAFAPVIVRVLMFRDEIHLTMGVMLILFFFLMLMTSKRVNEAVVQSLNLKFENTDLVDDLKSEILVRQKAEKELLSHQKHIESIIEKRTFELKNVNQELQKEIEERIRAEEALRQSEARYRMLIEQLIEGIVIAKDNPVRLDFASPAMENITGYAIDELLSLPPEDIGKLIYPEDREIFFERFQDRLKGRDVQERYEVRGLRKDGTVSHLAVSSVRIRDREELGTLAVFSDVTEKKMLESRLQRAQKMEAIGTLAGGVAHDLNNILSGLVSYPELLLLDIPQDSPLRSPILTIKKSGEKASVIVQDLLTLARRGVVTTEVLDVNHIVSEYLKSPEYEKLKSFHPEVRLETNLQRDLLNIDGSPVHLYKTIMNLVVNAAEAMPDGGKILITTENRYIDHPIRGYDDVEEGDFVVLTVSDTGVGISSLDADRIFEPFYTKKVMGRSGTGLGMAVVWGTVKDHNGYIDLQSTQGRGTTLTLYFPVTEQEMIKDSSPMSMEEFIGGGESILVVDDVEEQRVIASGMLKKLGYAVMAVPSGEKAVEYMKDHSVDLIILDMIMFPGIDGLETYKKILEWHPKQKAVIASGFSETDRVQEAQKLGAGQYLKKPYTLKKLGLAVKGELGIS